MKNIVGTLLYIVLAYCLVYSWQMRDAAQNPGLESLFNSVVEAANESINFQIETPKLKLKIMDGHIDSLFDFQDQLVAIGGDAKWDEGKLDFTFTTSGEIAPLVQQFHPRSIFLTGDYTLKAHVSGSWSDPQLHISLLIDKGTLNSLSTGFHAENITARIESDGKEAKLLSFTGSDGQGGEISGSGSILLNEKVPYALNITMDNISLVRLEHISGLFSGNLVLKGDVEAASLEGNLRANSVVLALNEVQSSPKTVDITYVNGQAPASALQETKKEYPLSFDLAVTAAQNVWITDGNLNSEWKGDIKVQGTAIEPLVFGAVEMLHGNYSMNGKNVTIKEGRIHFNGDPVRNSSLAVLGTLETNSIIAEALVSGPLTNPNLTLRSNPPMPQADILSHLIFGRGAAEISSQQSNQLRRSIKELKSMSSGNNVLDNVRGKFGIDRIEFSRGSGTELEDVSVQIGKYLTQGLYVGFNRGITSASNRIVLEAAIQPNLKLQAEISDTAEGELHLKWRHDY